MKTGVKRIQMLRAKEDENVVEEKGEDGNEEEEENENAEGGKAIEKEHDPKEENPQPPAKANLGFCVKGRCIIH